MIIKLRYFLQDSDEYRSLQKQYELLIQQLDMIQKEASAYRENAEKSRMEVYMLKSQLEAGTSTIRFELDSAKAENTRLLQVIETLRTELDSIKRENAQVGLFTELHAYYSVNH